MYGISNVSLTVMSTTHIHRCPRHFSEHQCVGTQHDGPPFAPPAHAGFLYQSSASAHRTRVHRCVATLRDRSSCFPHYKKPGAVACATTPGERRTLLHNHARTLCDRSSCFPHYKKPGAVAYATTPGERRTLLHNHARTLCDRSSCHSHYKKPGAVAYATTPGERRGILQTTVEIPSSITMHEGAWLWSWRSSLGWCA
jgi:hypothetical protein